MARRRVHSIRAELVRKSREAALCAVQTFNNPLVQFKSETYIVLMIIAWTYLLHAYYRSKGIEYRYFSMRGSRRIFGRTKHGAYKYWELERCLNDKNCPLDRDTINNLKFLIMLRHEIEHQMTMNLDNFLSARYQACAMNFRDYIKELFGEGQGLERYLTYSLQFVQISHDQAMGLEFADSIPDRLHAFITDFDNSLTDEEFQSQRYAYRLIFMRTNVNHRGQADKVIEFVSPDSEEAATLEKLLVVKKEVERRKYLPSQIVKIIRDEGIPRFKLHHHTTIWKVYDAKQPGKGFGVKVANTWYWYDTWLNHVREHCRANEHLFR